MADIIKWAVILVCPGEDELPLLAGLSSRSDAQVVAVADAEGTSLGAGLAEVMGIPVVKDLAEVIPGAARYLVYPELNDSTVPFVDLASELGLEPLRTRDFIRVLEEPRREAPPAVGDKLPLFDQEGLELESAAIHRTLSRIEEALDRESLLRWLLGLAIRATGADSGSIMLVDEGTEELYVAFAEGLSQQTMLRTRVHLGEGISGRVALSRQAELITSDQHPGARRDRSGVGSAVCAPLVWDGRLLGVLNLSTSAEAVGLNKDALSVVTSLSHRFGLILDRFLRIQRVRDGELFRIMEEGLLREKRNPEALATTLCSWAGDLAEVAGASAASLSVLTADGDLFTADAEGSHYESPPADVKVEALTSGRAIVLRPGDLADSDPIDNLREATVFHLPVGTEPVRALFTVEFTSPVAAHQFHSISGDILVLVGRHLEDYLDRVQSADQIDRLTTLATALSDLVLADGGGLSQQKVLTAAQRLTGARRALLIEDSEALGEADTAEHPRAIIRAGANLLRETGRRGWNSTIIEGGPAAEEHPHAILAVPLAAESPFPGLLLWDKERLHPLDAAGFTEMDVLFVQRLLPLLNLARKPEPALTPAQPDASANVVAAVEPAADLHAVLKREMDRCDRYHTCLGLTAYRAAGYEGQEGRGLAAVAGELVRHLRSSDQVFALGRDTVLVLVPEDVQSLPRLQKRVMGVLRNLAGEPDLALVSSARTYPGAANSPGALVDSLLSALG